MNTVGFWYGLATGACAGITFMCVFNVAVLMWMDRKGFFDNGQTEERRDG